MPRVSACHTHAGAQAWMAGSHPRLRAELSATSLSKRPSGATSATPSPADLIYVAFSDGARHFGVLEPGTSRYVAVLRLGYMSAGKWQVGAEDRVLYIPVESIQWVEPHVGSLP